MQSWATVWGRRECAMLPLPPAQTQVRSIREIGRRIKGPLWGTDCIVLEGEGTSDLLKKWAERIDESISEAKLVDAYK